MYPFRSLLILPTTRDLLLSTFLFFAFCRFAFSSLFFFARFFRSSAPASHSSFSFSGDFPVPPFASRSPMRRRRESGSSTQAAGGEQGQSQHRECAQSQHRECALSPHRECAREADDRASMDRRRDQPRQGREGVGPGWQAQAPPLCLG
jgi:hypothetical protein